MKRVLLSLFLIGSLLFAGSAFGQVTASFSYNIIPNHPNGCSDSAKLYFTDMSQSASGSIVSYLWNFNDPSSGTNNTSSLQNPSHLFSYTGNFVVKLQVTNSLGNTDDTTIFIQVRIQPQIAFFPSLQPICINASPISVATAIVLNGIPGFWNYSGAGVSSTGTFSPSLAGVGTHDIKYIFTSVMGCVDSVSKPITVKPKPTASFIISAPQQCLQNNFFNPINNSTASAGSTYAWDFGDGFISTIQNPLHTYTSEGTYFVKLVVSSNGCNDSVSQAVSILPRPTASFTVNMPSQCYNNNNFSFSNSSSVSSGTLSYMWDFGDGDSSSLANPVHHYLYPGTYNAKLTIITSLGCTDSIIKNINVKSPNYSYTNITVCPNNLPYNWNGNLYYIQGTYYDTIPQTSGCDSIAVLNLYVASTHTSTTNITICPLQLPYSWNGNTYNASGNYNVNFPNPSGCDSIAYLNLAVRDSLYHDTTVYICQSQLPYIWNGSSYSAGGTYFKSFTSSAGCDSVSVLSLVVISNTPANFSYVVHDSACGSLGRRFYSSAADSYSWNFGDGNKSTESNPVHTYQNYGVYTVKLVAANQCTADSITKIVIISPATINIQPAAPHVLYANRQCASSDSLWTNYYYDNNTPYDLSDDTLLLSIQKNGNYIGDINDGIFQVKLVATQGAGSNTGILLTNPLITNPSGFWVMNRYWNVTPTQQPTSPVGIKFYYNTQDLNDVNGSYPTHNLNHNDLMFYKTTGGNPDPTTNLAGATTVTSIINGATADTTHWVYSSLGTARHIAEFAVSHFSGGGGGATVNGQILPLKLISFDAHKNNKTTLLQWITGSEVNLKNFEVQRSADGEDFAAIGNIAAIGTGYDRINYQFTDSRPLQAAAYYRLKMTDKDGSFTFSPIRKVSNTAFEIAVYPNPVRDILSVKMTSDSRKNVQFEIVSMEGKVLQTIKTIVVAGSLMKPINVSYLSAGNYFIRLTSDNDNVVMKFEKM